MKVNYTESKWINGISKLYPPKPSRYVLTWESFDGCNPQVRQSMSSPSCCSGMHGQAKRTCECPRKSPATWKLDARVASLTYHLSTQQTRLSRAFACSCHSTESEQKFAPSRLLRNIKCDVIRRPQASRCRLIRAKRPGDKAGNCSLIYKYD